MHKKLGPLETWQWVAVGVAVGLVYYLYSKYKSGGSSSSTSGTSSTNGIDPNTGLPYSQEGAVDPTTGVPYASEGAASGGAAGGGLDTTGMASATGTSLDQELSDLGSIETLMSGLSGMGAGVGTDTGANGSGSGSGTTSVYISSPSSKNVKVGKGSAFAKYYKQVTGKNAPSSVSTTNFIYEAFKNGIKATVLAPRSGKATHHTTPHNPGHTVTTHPHGKKSVSSSAHNAGNTGKKVAPPNHQRAASQSHIGTKVTPPHKEPKKVTTKRR